MGKVGSSTVVETLKNLELGVPIVHTHTLRASTLKKAIQKERTSGTQRISGHLIASSILIPKLENGLFPSTVITLTREPIGRAVSFVFEDWRKKAPHARQTDGQLDPQVMASAVEEILESVGNHADPSGWFDEEIKGVFGIDIFSVPFDFERGFVLLQRGPVRVLLMRMEDLDGALPLGIEACLGVPARDVEIRRANEGSKSWYRDSFQKVKQSLRLREELVDRILSTRYVRHFYPEQIDALRRRWLVPAHQR